MDQELNTTQEDSASASVEAARSEAIAALEAEMAKAEAAESAKAGEPPAKQEAKVEAKVAEATDKDSESTTEAPKPETEENRIAVVMRARRQAQKVREDAETRAQAMLREVEERQRQLEVRERSVVSKLREKPIDALRELGLDPREFFERAVEDPKQLDPVSQLKAELEALRAEQRQALESIAQRERQQREAQEQARQAQADAAAVQNFIKESLTDKFPALVAAYSEDPDSLAEEGIKVLKLYAKNGGDPTELTNQEIASYLEERERKRYSSIRSRLEQVDSEAAQPAGGNVTITQKDAAQKRSRPKKTVSEMTVEERRQEAIRVMSEGA